MFMQNFTELSAAVTELSCVKSLPKALQSVATARTVKTMYLLWPILSTKTTLYFVYH